VFVVCCSCIVVYFFCFLSLFPNSVSLEGSNNGNKELSPFSESTGGDRRLPPSCVPIWFRFGTPCARLVFAQGNVSGPWALDLRYKPHFRHIQDPEPRPWALDLASVIHFWYIFGPWAGTLGARFDDSYTLSTHF